MSRRQIIQCDNCKQFFNETTMLILEVMRSGSKKHFDENWCQKCVEAIGGSKSDYKKDL